MARRRLSKFVPVRVSPQDSIDLRRWARQQRSNVSEVIRELIEARRKLDSQRDSQAVAA